MAQIVQTTIQTHTKQTPAPIAWSAHEYTHYEKTNDWYWTLGIIAIAGAVASVIFHNVLLAFLILLGAFVVAIYASREPELVEFELSSRGVRINKTMYPYRSLESFWVEHHEQHPSPKLLIKSQKMLMPLIIIPLEHMYPEEIRNYLLPYLQEEEHQEPLAHHIMEILGF